MSKIRIEYLKSQLDHPLPTVRFNAVRALGELQSKDVVQILQEVMQTDVSEGVRHAAKIALTELGYEGYAATE